MRSGSCLPHRFKLAELTAHIRSREIVLDLEKQLEPGIAEKRLPAFLVEIFDLRQVLHDEEKFDAKPGGLRRRVLDDFHALQPGEFIEQDKIAIGGEESAGLTIRGHVPEKDGILACLLVAEMIAARGTSLAEQRAKLFKEVGREYWPIRVNLHLQEDVQRRLRDKLAAEPKALGRRPVTKIVRTDGLKLIFDDGDWVLMRPSGTEPLVRIYSESTSEKAAHQMAEEAQKWISA